MCIYLIYISANKKKNWIHGVDSRMIMLWKHRESTHDTLLIEQKLNYQLLVVNLKSTKGFPKSTKKHWNPPKKEFSQGEKPKSTRERI